MSLCAVFLFQNKNYVEGEHTLFIGTGYIFTHFTLRNNTEDKKSTVARSFEEQLENT